MLSTTTPAHVAIGRIGRPAFPAPFVWRAGLDGYLAQKKHAARSRSHASSRRRPGPITTGFSCCAKAVEQRLSTRATRRMGPGSAFAAITWPGRRVFVKRRSRLSLSSRRRPGPITTGFSCCAKAVEQRLSTQATRRMGPGSAFAALTWPGRRVFVKRRSRLSLRRPGEGRDP